MLVKASYSSASYEKACRCVLELSIHIKVVQGRFLMNSPFAQLLPAELVYDQELKVLVLSIGNSDNES